MDASLVALLGGVGTAIGLVRALPQLARLLRVRDAAGVSLDTAATSSIVSVSWSVYGLLTHQWPVLLATGASGVVFAAVAVLAWRFGRELRELRTAPIWGAALACAGVVGGAPWLGMLLAVSVLAANLPQLRVARRESNLSAVSSGTWLLSLSDGVTWLTYAVVTSHLAIAVYGVLQILTSAPITLRALNMRSDLRVAES